MKTTITQPSTEQYRTAETRNAMLYAPPQYACKKCMWPVISGYCCTTCGDSNPSQTWEQEQE